MKEEKNTMRKIYVLLFFIFCSFNVQGQEPQRKNIIKAGANLSGYSEMAFNFPGFVLGYERLLNKNFSIGFDTGLSLYSLFAEINSRWYPWEEYFFIGLGIGLGGLYPKDPSEYLFYMVTPSIGFNFNIGKKKRWAFIPSVTTGVLLEDWRPFFLTEFALEAGIKF